MIRLVKTKRIDKIRSGYICFDIISDISLKRNSPGSSYINMSILYNLLDTIFIIFAIKNIISVGYNYDKI